MNDTTSTISTNLTKKTKIVCTIGPACEAPETLKQMIQSGMNVARLNFSHGSYDDHASIIKNVRAVSDELGIPVAVMQDLQGPKVRVSLLEKPIPVTVGQEIVIGKDFNLDFDVFGTVQVGERILIEDGRIELKVTAKTGGAMPPDTTTGKIGQFIICSVVTGGLIQSHKGVNIPDSTILFPVITEKDIEDLHFGLEHDVDAVAVSFVRNAQDILTIKNEIDEFFTKKNTKNTSSGTPISEKPLVIAKIEKREGIACLGEILAAADGVMVARGDLGVELPEEEVVILQKEIVKKCREAHKLVIVATQMLESMLTNPKPTRAEVSDVSNAVIDGVDCVMLSEETANGSYPLQAVREMTEIIVDVEESDLITNPRSVTSPPNAPTSFTTKSKKLWNQSSLIWGSQVNLEK